jgi:cytochrome c2
MTFPIVSVTAAACLVMAACGGERPNAAPEAGMPMAGMHGEASTQATQPADPRAALFVRKGCPQCHTISALGVKSPAEIGPDLTYAYSDVQSRFNMKLEEFLKNPTGTMQVVLSSQIKLSPEERDSVIHILKELHEDAEDAAEAETDH